MSYLSRSELESLGFQSLGINVSISSKASLYNCSKISVGDNVRIDDFCVLSAGEGGIEVGNYVHIAIYSSLIGRGKITLRDFTNISSRVSIYSSTDDFSGEYMTSPTVPERFTNVFSAEVVLGRHAIVGAGSVILPGLTIGDCSAIGALSLVNRDCEGFYIYAGNPIRKLKARKKDLLRLERALLAS